jgi:MFS family permease
MRASIFEPAVEVTQRFWNGLSAIIGALIVFLIGWLIAKFLRLLLIKFFKILNIDKFSEDSGFKTLLEKGNITKDVSELLGIAVYWIIMLVVIFVSINFAGLNIPSTVIDGLLGFIPKFILGLLIFIFSIFLGAFFNGIVRTAAGNVGIQKAATLGKLTQVAIVTFGVVIALQQIGIAAEFIGNVFIILLAAFAFGAALAFALGAKDIVKKNLEEFLAKKDTGEENKQ